MSKTNLPYPEEFRQKAVELARRGDRKVQEVASELGVSHLVAQLDAPGRG